jgi:hypothetical protein
MQVNGVSPISSFSLRALPAREKKKANRKKVDVASNEKGG